MKPGKPVLFGTRDGNLAFGLPVKRVVIFLLGGVSEIEKEPE